MTAPQRKDSYFPELEGDEQRLADEWLEGYVRLVVRIYREHVARLHNGRSHPSIDVPNGTGTIEPAEDSALPSQ